MCKFACVERILFGYRDVVLLELTEEGNQHGG